MDGFRHEEKFFISTASARMLQGRLRAALGRDGHAGEDGRYFIRSLYFDDYQQSGLFDKIEGVEKREKYRIRFYDMDDRYIRLELKQKLGSLTRKRSAPLTREQADAILAGDTWPLWDSDDPLLRNFYLKARTRLPHRHRRLYAGGVRVPGCPHHIGQRPALGTVPHRLVQPRALYPACAAGGPAGAGGQVRRCSALCRPAAAAAPVRCPMRHFQI